MTPVSLHRLLLRARIYWIRLGWLDLLSCSLLAVGVVLCSAVAPHLDRRLQAQQANLEDVQALAAHRARQSQSAPVRLPEAQQNLQKFHAALGDVRQTERYLTTMFSEADKQDLELDQGEYKLSYDRNGRFYAYTIKLPVSGSYAALRNFSTQLLLALPFASLDAISFKRRNSNRTSLEANLNVTLYLQGPEGYAAGVATTATRQDASP